MKMKKRIIALFLTLTMLCSLSLTASAVQRSEYELSLPGITVTVYTDVISEEVHTYNDVTAGVAGTYVLYPTEMLENKEKYPVIIWANGSWCPVQTYYGYLSALAEAGYIVVADTDLYAGSGDSAVDSVNYILSDNEDPDSPFFGRINTDAIGSVGHSLGGKGVMNAAAKDNRITCVISLAGNSTADMAEQLTVPILYFAGENDMNVPAEKYVLASYEATNAPAVYACLADTGHFAPWYAPDLYINYSVQWFNLYLKGETSNLAVFTENGTLANDETVLTYDSRNLT